MKERLLSQLKKFDEEELFFGRDFIDDIQFGECADTYVVRVNDYASVILNKDTPFKANYLKLIDYLTKIKSQVVNGSVPERKSAYYEDWLVYKQNYNIRKAWFYATVQNEEDTNEVTDLLINILGLSNYHAVTSALSIPYKDYRSHAENVMSYVGNVRAIRDVCMKYLDPKVGTQWQFHLWNMTPSAITDRYGNVFYLGGELSRLDYCPYDYRPEEYYYEKLYNDLYRNLEKDIPANKGITREKKERIWEEICREILDKPVDEDDEFDFDTDISGELSEDIFE